MEIIIKEGYDQICKEAALLIRGTWMRKRNLVLGLATGKTPLGVYKELIEMSRKGELDFSGMVAFSLDEYLGLAEEHPRSFASFLSKHFYDHIPIKRENISHLSGTPDDIENHCKDYEAKIKSVGGIDIQLLGIGRNGHIGFNEPSSSLASRTRVKTLTPETVEANAQYFENQTQVPRFCLTMGIGTICEAKEILLLASGNAKSQAIRDCVEGPVTASVPASFLQIHPQAKVIIDNEAASLLERKEYYRWVHENKHRVSDFLKKG